MVLGPWSRSASELPEFFMSAVSVSAILTDFAVGGATLSRRKKSRLKEE